MRQPHNLLEPGDTVDRKPDDRNQESHSNTEVQWASLTQTTSTVHGTLRNPLQETGALVQVTKTVGVD